MSKTIEIRILASADPSLRSVPRELAGALKLARQQASAELKGLDGERRTAVKRITDTETRAARDASRQRERENNALMAEGRKLIAAELREKQKLAREKERLAKMEQRAEEKSFRDRQRAAESAGRDAARRAKAEADAQIAEEKRATREKLKAFDQRLKARQAEEREILHTAARTTRAEEVAAKRSAKEARSARAEMIRDVASRTGSNLRSLGRSALNLGADMLGGMGVDLSPGNAFGRSVELRRMATQLSNAGYMPAVGNDPGVARVDPGEITRRVKEAADYSATGRGQTAEGLQAFVGKTGRLQEGLDLIKELGVLSKATGADLKDMTDAAGDVSNALGDMDKGEGKVRAVQSVMRQIAGQGKIGAVEIKDLAVQMAKLGAAAGSFEGNAQDNLGVMGALVQMSRAKGGSSSATGAATSVAAMVNTLKTPARIKEFEAVLGKGALYNEKTGLYKSPEEIILKSISATKGDPMAFKKMWANVQGARAVEGFADIYRQARSQALNSGKSEEVADLAGRKAVTAEFDKYKKISMGQGEIDESFRARMADPDSKAQQFQNKMDDFVERLGTKLVPALERLIPTVEKVADAFAKVIDWASANPGKAITLAIVGSIAKAGIETALAGALTNLISRMAGLGKGPGAAPVPGGGGGGGAGPAMAAAAVGVGLAFDQGTKLYNEQRRDGRDMFDLSDPLKDPAMRGKIKELELIKKYMTEGNVEALERMKISRMNEVPDLDWMGERDAIAEKYDPYINTARRDGTGQGRTPSVLARVLSKYGATDVDAAAGSAGEASGKLGSKEVKAPDVVAALTQLQAATSSGLASVVTAVGAAGISGGPSTDPKGRTPGAAPNH